LEKDLINWAILVIVQKFLTKLLQKKKEKNNISPI